jgi:hypothetical protein
MCCGSYILHRSHILHVLGMGTFGHIALIWQGLHVTILSVMGMLFCIFLRTVGLRLCTFCSLDLQILHDHYCTTVQNISNY